MVKKGLINRMEENWGSKKIINYNVSERERLILNEILAPYEELFPRNNEKGGEINEKIKQRMMMIMTKIILITTIQDQILVFFT